MPLARRPKGRTESALADTVVLRRWFGEHASRLAEVFPATGGRQEVGAPLSRAQRDRWRCREDLASADLASAVHRRVRENDGPSSSPWRRDTASRSHPARWRITDSAVELSSVRRRGRYIEITRNSLCACRHRPIMHATAGFNRKLAGAVDKYWLKRRLLRTSPGAGHAGTAGSEE